MEPVKPNRTLARILLFTGLFLLFSVPVILLVIKSVKKKKQHNKSAQVNTVQPVPQPKAGIDTNNFPLTIVI